MVYFKNISRRGCIFQEQLQWRGKYFQNISSKEWSIFTTFLTREGHYFKNISPKEGIILRTFPLRGELFKNIPPRERNMLKNIPPKKGCYFKNIFSKEIIILRIFPPTGGGIIFFKNISTGGGMRENYVFPNIFPQGRGLL